MREESTKIRTLQKRITELEKAISRAAEILEIWECEGTLGEGGQELAQIIFAANNLNALSFRTAGRR